MRSRSHAPKNAVSLLLRHSSHRLKIWQAKPTLLPNVNFKRILNCVARLLYHNLKEIASINEWKNDYFIFWHRGVFLSWYDTIRLNMPIISMSNYGNFSKAEYTCDVRRWVWWAYGPPTTEKEKQPVREFAPSYKLPTGKDGAMFRTLFAQVMICKISNSYLCDAKFACASGFDPDGVAKKETGTH